MLVDQLIDDACAGGDSSAPAISSKWAVRAAHLVRIVADCGDAVVYQCSARAFDDADTRVRGLAWCLLSEMQESAVTQDSVNGIIAAAFKERIAAPFDYPERDADASAFAAVVGATVMCASADQMLKAIEGEYIAMHGGVEGWRIDAGTHDALAFLDHHDSGCRLAAIRVAARAGKDDPAACEAIYQRMITDTEPGVRLAAMVAYTDLFYGTRDPQCLRRAAAIVLDEHQPMFHRFAAYCGLFTVCGRRFDGDSPLRIADEEQLCRLREGASGATWPVGIDWEFVNKCARGKCGHP
jgi:hypothetical protein